jgi:hypothetical protein
MVSHSRVVVIFFVVVGLKALHSVWGGTKNVVAPSAAAHDDSNAKDLPQQVRAKRYNYEGSKWCPKARCYNSLLCEPCQRRYLIILSTGRSASTTLTWMMDSLPGIRMSGENNALLQDFYMTHKKVFEDPNFIGGQGKRNPYGRHAIPEGALSCILQNTVELITPPEHLPVPDADLEANTVIGFKTIRSHRPKTGFDIQRFAQYLKENIPCARYLVNYRSDVSAIAKSMQLNVARSENLTAVEQEMKEEHQNLMALYDALGRDRAFLLDSSEWTKDVTVLNEAVQWLGFQDSCYFHELLEFNTVSRKDGKKYGNSKTSFSVSSSNCTSI